MADDTTPAPEPEAAVPPVAAPADAASPPAAAPRKRPLWPWFLAGGLVLFFGIVAGAVILVIALIVGIGGNPERTVVNYDQAFENADCAEFKATTTSAFQKDFFGDTLNCSDWVKNAQELTVDGVYEYKVTVSGSKVTGGIAEVTTKETDTSSGDATDYELTYHLVREGGKWLIDSVDNVGE